MRVRTGLIFLIASWLLAVSSLARADAPQIATELLSKGTDRSAASPAAGEGADFLAQEALKAIGGAGGRVFKQAFLMTVPVVEECRASVRTASAATEPATNFATEKELTLSPLLPMGGRVPEFQSGGSGEFPVIYGGHGRLEDLTGKEIRGRVVALELSGSDGEGAAAWKRCAGLGAAGIVFLGDAQTQTAALLSKAIDIPLSIPRFYCDDADAAAWFRGAGGERDEKLAISLKVRWEEKRVENVICVIPETGMAWPANGGGGWEILQARYDGTSQVMGRSPGATSAADSGILMDLAEQVARAPAHAGVVCVWTGGDEWDNRGTREFMELVQRGLSDPAQAVPRLMAKRAEAQRQAGMAEAIVGAVKRLEAGQPSAGTPDETQGRKAVEEELLRQGNVAEKQLERARAGGNSAEASTWQGRKRDLVAAAGAVMSGGPATAEQEKLIHEAATVADARWTAELVRRRAAAGMLEDWPEIRSAMPRRDPMLLVSLALSAGTPRPLQFGFFSRSFYSGELDASGAMAGFARAFRRYADQSGADFPGAAFSAEEMLGGVALEARFPVKVGFSSDAAILRGLPAVAAATMLDADTYFDTANDTEAHLQWPVLARQEQALIGILIGTPVRPGLLADPLFYGRAQLADQASAQDLTLYEEDAGGALPRLTAGAALVGGENELAGKPLGPMMAGTRRTDWYLTHADGTARFEAVSRAGGSELRLQAFGFDESGHATEALADNQADTRQMAASFYAEEGRPVRAMVFAARGLDVYGLFDPRYLDELEQVQILNGRRQDEMEIFGAYMRGGAAALFVPMEGDDVPEPWQLLFSRGNVGNRMILIHADEKHPNGVGFQTADVARLGDVPWRAAQDFMWLDRKRKADLEKFGISSQIISELQAESERQLAAGKAAEGARKYPEQMAAADAVWALQEQEYADLISTSNGIIHGVIFLLLGVVPFSFFLERLLIGSANVYRQLGWFAGFFALMTAGLWFHPAFRISPAPLMILLAFFILGLSVAVVYILWGKFQEEVTLLRGGAAGGAHMTSLRRGAVLGAAVRLGLSNMRRRAMRTAFTLVTLVLLTFTLLCFTSVRETLEISPQAVGFWKTGNGGLASPAAGILVRQRGWQALPEETLELARGLALGPGVALADGKTAGDGNGVVAGRWWYASEKAEQPWLLPVSADGAGGKTYLVSGLLGIEASEREFMGENAAAFAVPAGGSEDACWLPSRAQAELGVRPGERVFVMGYGLRVAGFFTPEQLSRWRQLTGDPMTPLEPGAGARPVPAGGANGAAQNAALPESGYRFLDAGAVAVVPAWVTERLGGRLTSILVRPAGIVAAPDEAGRAAIEAVGEALARRSAFSVYVATGRGGGADSGGGVLSINAAESSSPQDLGVVLVPMVLAGIIVLNTMLGAVTERAREIHVYTSIGLAPAHVGMLFLAEAGALGTLGVVFGYIAGQGVATLLSHTHWMPGVDLNYSSLSAILTMGLVLGVVMASALWPARSASRIAAPSLSRSWLLPRPEGDLLSVDLPFTVNETAARGICAFLAEFLVSAAQTGNARFTADQIEGFSQPTTYGEGHEVRGITARVWLAPFDLGVIQTMRISLHPTDQAHVFDVHVELMREAGNPGTWRRLNRPFLTEVRKQFLLWRSLDNERVEAYIRRSEELFEAV